MVAILAVALLNTAGGRTADVPNQVNGIAINWNAGLIYALAGFVGEPTKSK